MERPTASVRGGATTEVEISLVPATLVRGKVVDRETSQPLGGAAVHVWNQSGDSHNLTTGDDGTFQAFVGPGQFWASLRKLPPLYLWPIEDSRGGTVEPGTEELTLEPISNEPRRCGSRPRG